MGRRIAQLALHVLAILSTTSQAVTVLLDTAAAAHGSASGGRRHRRKKSPRAQPRRRARHNASAWPHSDDHPWQWAEYNTNACLHPDDLELTSDECRSLTAYQNGPRRLGDPWLVSTPLVPRGCSESADGVIYYNEHRVGSANSSNRPICKSDGYTIFAGGCPSGFGTLDDVECNAASQVFMWPWAPANPFDDAALTGGCYSKGGQMYYNDHGTGTSGDRNAFSICSSTIAPKRVAAAAAMGDAAAAAAMTAAAAQEQAAAAMAEAYQAAVAAHIAAEATAAAPMAAPSALAPSIPMSPMAGAAAAAPSQSHSASAVGDPHMTSITGAKFDIARSGNHTLFHIPRFSAREAALVDVTAFVRREGLACSDMYINALHITGKWADDKQPGGLSFLADHRSHVSGRWMPFGKLELKVVHGKTNRGVKYLNVLAKHLSKVGIPIGGILGLDDHTEAATPEKHCRRTMTL